MIYDYCYKPHPVFLGSGPLYLGLELEITTPYREKVEAAEIASSFLGDIGYLKEDGSIDRGFEIVTHPMSHDWAASHFPWRMLERLESMGCDPDDNGLHVHVSRDAFDSPLHLYRWLKFFYRNQSDVVQLARRESPAYAPFNDHDRRNAKAVAKGESCDVNRYAAINTKNRDTLELRVFASSLDSQEVKAALDLAASTVEYTRALTAVDITRRAGWDWTTFCAWVAERPQYADLTNEIRATHSIEELPCAC